MIANDKNLFSIGQIACQFRRPVHVLRTALDSIGAEPDLALNDVEYFSCDTERVELLNALFDTRRANAERNKNSEWSASVPIPPNYRPVNPNQ